MMEVKEVEVCILDFFISERKKGSQVEMDPEDQRVLIEVSVTVCNYFHSKLWHRCWLIFKATYAAIPGGWSADY